VRTGAAIILVAAVAVLGGCSSSQGPEVSAAAQRFYTSVAEHDGEQACVMLSPDTRTELEQSSGRACHEAVLREGLPAAVGVDSTRVYGTMAIVTTPSDTMFLSRFSEGWLVTGVGCQPTDQAERYDCTLTGG
jgi:hypothetical protein